MNTFGLDYDDDPLKNFDPTDLEFRKDAEYGIIENTDNLFPNLTGSEPLFVKTLPTAKIPLITTASRTSNDKTRQMSEQANKERIQNPEKMSMVKLFHRIAMALLGILDDVLNKPDDSEDWVSYLTTIFEKKDRILAAGSLMVFISIFIVIFSNTGSSSSNVVRLVETN